MRRPIDLSRPANAVAVSVAAGAAERLGRIARTSPPCRRGPARDTNGGRSHEPLTHGRAGRWHGNHVKAVSQGTGVRRDTVRTPEERTPRRTERSDVPTTSPALAAKVAPHCDKPRQAAERCLARPLRISSVAVARYATELSLP